MFFVVLLLNPLILQVMDENSRQSLVNDAKGLTKMFRVTVKIELFGHVIFEKTWPPQNS